MSPAIEIRRHHALTPFTYAQLDQRQREIAARLHADPQASGAILISELAPVITYGRRTAPRDLTLAPALYAQMGVELHATDRGGFATYHGPGQWVVFVVDRLERLTGDSRGVRKAVCGLLNAALEVARKYEPAAEIREGAEMGVWGPHGKISAVGIHIEQGVLLHGLAFNGFRTPQSFYGLRPCGLDEPVAFVLPESLRSPEAEFEILRAHLLDSISREFY